MPQQDVTIREQRLLPIAPMRPRSEQLLLDDVLPVLPHELPEPFDARDPPAPERALEDDRRVVLPRRRRLELPPARHPRPLAEQIDVGRVVHLIDDVRPTRPTPDLPEDRLAVRL